MCARPKLANENGRPVGRSVGLCVQFNRLLLLDERADLYKSTVWISIAMNVNVISEFSCRPFAFVWILFATRRFAVRGHAEVIYWRNKWKTLADCITDNIIYDSRRLSRKQRCRVCVYESCLYKWMKWVYRPSIGRRNLRCERISYLVGAYEWTLISCCWFDSVEICTPHIVKFLLTFGAITFFVASLFSISDAHTIDHSWR